MKTLWQNAVSLAANLVFPLAILLFPLLALDLILSGCSWYLNPVLGKAVLAADTTAALLTATSSAAIGLFLRRQWTEASPYVCKSDFSLLSSRSYLGIAETDHAAFTRLLKTARRGGMPPLRPWLLTYDIAWNVLMAAFAPVVIVPVIAVLVMRAFARFVGGAFRMRKAQGR